MSLVRTLAAVSAIALFATVGLADVLQVPGDYPTIQAAINAATNGDEIAVASGNYAEAVDLLGKAVHLRSESGATTTIIDATGLGISVVTCVSGETDSTVIDGFTITGGDAAFGGGVYIVGSDPRVVACIIEGNDAANNGGGVYSLQASPTFAQCTVRDNASSAVGGGMYANQGSPQVTECTFESNHTLVSGGGLYLSSGQALIDQCTFTDNTAETGGGVYIAGGAPSLTGCGIDTNAATKEGGGVYVSGSAQLTVSDCEIIGNTAATQGGGLFTRSSDVTITASEFAVNQATLAGGAVMSDSGTLTLSDSDIRGNTVTQGQGGGLYLLNCVATLEQCALEQNAAPQQTGGAIRALGGTIDVSDSVLRGNTASNGGGAVYSQSAVLDVVRCYMEDNATPSYNGGAVHLDSGTSTIRESVIRDNDAYSGGGVYSWTGSLTVVQCIVTGNTASYQGGGIYTSSQSLFKVINSTLSGNMATNGGRGIYVSGQNAQVFNCILWPTDEIDGQAADVRYSNTFYPGEGNIDLDPLFVNPAVNDFRLMPGSPCIDAANNLLVPGGTDTDADGSPRFVDDPDTADTGVSGGAGRDAVVDMGAYEYQWGSPADLAVVGMTYNSTDGYVPYAAELLWAEDRSVTGELWTTGADGPVGPTPTNFTGISNGPMGSAIAFFETEPPSGEPFGARFIAGEGYPLGWFGGSVGAYDTANADVAGVIERSSDGSIADLIGSWSFQITHIEGGGVYTRHGQASFNSGGGFFSLAFGATGDPIWAGEGFEFTDEPDNGRFNIGLGSGDTAVMYLNADKSMLLIADMDARDGDSWMGVGLRQGIELTDADVVGSYRVGVLYEGQDAVEGGDMSDVDDGRFTRTSRLALARDGTFKLYDLADADHWDFSNPTASGVWTHEHGVVTFTDSETGVTMLIKFSDNGVSGLVLGFQQQDPDVFERPMTMVTRVTPACPADLTGDGEVNTQDFVVFLNAWASRDLLADWDENGLIDTRDFVAYLNDWVAGC